MPISPNQGSSGGGTLVTITGTGLSGTTAVRFGTRAATAVTNVSPTQVTAVSPSGNGSVGVTVTTPGGTSNPIPFYYVGAPFKQSLSPASGSTTGGGTVTINGTGLSTASSVAFGANTAVPTIVSDGQITVTAPAGAAGSVGVSVTTAGGTNNGLSYTYVAAPTVTTVTPASGPGDGRHDRDRGRYRSHQHERGHLRREPGALPRALRHRGVGRHAPWSGRCRRRRRDQRCGQRDCRRRVHLHRRTRHLTAPQGSATAGDRRPAPERTR